MMLVAPLLDVLTVPEPPVLRFRIVLVVLDGEKAKLVPVSVEMMILPPVVVMPAFV